MLHTEAVNPNVLKTLQILMQMEELQDFYLVGGTALALQIGHRLSIDLDLFSGKDIQTNVIKDILHQKFETRISGEFHNTLNLFLDGIKVDLISFKYPLIEGVQVNENIRMASLPDIAAMKLSAIAQRGSKKDFYDIYFLLEKFGIKELLQFHKEKFTHTEQFHIVKSLTWFDDAEQEPDPIMIIKTTWQDIKKRLQQAITTL
jgi:predicted nucleotidyltransferase component of viral defense system